MLLSPPTTRGAGWFFSGLHFENLIEEQEVKFTNTLGYHPRLALGAFNHQNCSHWASINYGLWFPIPERFFQKFQLMSFCSNKSWLYIYLPVSPIWLSSLPSVLSSLKDLRRVADFHFVKLLFLVVWTWEIVPSSLLEDIRWEAPFLFIILFFFLLWTFSSILRVERIISWIPTSQSTSAFINVLSSCFIYFFSCTHTFYF